MEPKMQLAMEQPEVVKSMQAALAKPARAAAIPVSGPAVDSKPLAGGEITIRIALSPGMITLLAAPAAVLVSMLVGWLILTTAGLPLYGREMIGAAIVNTVGGIVAALPVFILMKRGAAAIAQAAILGIAVRCGSVLMGLLAAGAPAWGLDRMPLVWWVIGFYFPMLIAETTVIAWLSNKATR